VSESEKDLEHELIWPGSAHEASRFILSQLPGSDPIQLDRSDSERYGRNDEPPALIAPELLDDGIFRAIDVGDPKTLRAKSDFAGFLDGTQNVKVVNQVDGIPIVWATVSAAIRARINRRMISWSGSSPIVRKAYYVPFRYVSGIDARFKSHPLVVDTAKADHSGNFPSRHPDALVEAAHKKIQLDREALESQLAELWCASENGVLFVDGSITASASVASSLNAVGVIKSHRRLYADDDSFRVLVGLSAGQRTPIFRIAPRARNPVASWYVRVRGAKGRDALFGLVRVEASITDDISSRADEVSRWIIAEGAPLALPDGRWDKMAYGIRDTEEFLRAIS
jgi:hypothetical protein